MAEWRYPYAAFPHRQINSLVDRDQFKTILGEVARDVFEHRALHKGDYIDVITPLVETEK